VDLSHERNGDTLWCGLALERRRRKASSVSGRRWRSRIGSWLHRTRLLGAVECVLCALARALALRDNAAFRRANPGFALPPAARVFETAGHASAAEYRASGERHARVILDVARQALGRARLDILEWGCGTARVLRHVRESGLDPESRLAGIDVDEESIHWCRQQLPDIEFAICGTTPVLPYEDGSFDVVYHYSVLTHLGVESAPAWLRELARVLRQDGVMIGTTHGDRYLDMLLPEEARVFRAGSVVTRRWAAEGQKRFLTFHPASAVRRLLLDFFHDVRQLECADSGIPQDLWLAIGPRP